MDSSAAGEGGAPDLDPFKALNSLMDEDEDEAGLVTNSTIFLFPFCKKNH